MDELREKGYAYLRELDLVFYIMTGAVCLMTAMGTSGPVPDGTQRGSEPIAAVHLSTTVIWIIAGVIALIGIMAYFILRQRVYSYISWVLTEAGPRLQEPLPAFLHVPWLWRLSKRGSGKNNKLPLPISLTVQRYVQTCSAMGIDPGLRSLQIAGLVISILFGLLIVVAFVATEAISPDSSRTRALFAWALPLAPILQLLVLGFCITMQGAFAIMIATSYGRINAILDNRDAMAYAMRNSQTGGSGYRGD
jgi:hypothetical protein